MKRGGTVYIMANPRRTVLYIGVTEDLARRVLEHRDKRDPKSFTARYNCTVLVYFENFHHIEEAISEEKRLKSLLRSKKEDLINSVNPLWKDLFETLID